MKIYKNHIELITENSTKNLISLIVDYINKLEINSNSDKCQVMLLESKSSDWLYNPVVISVFDP